MIPSRLNLTLFSRVVISVASGNTRFYKETAGQEVDLHLTEAALVARVSQLRCAFRPGFTAAAPSVASVSVAFATEAKLNSVGGLSCPLPVVWNSATDHVWLTL